MVEIHPVEHTRPLPAVEKVERDKGRKQPKSDSQEANKEEPAEQDGAPPHIDEYA